MNERSVDGEGEAIESRLAALVGLTDLTIELTHLVQTTLTPRVSSNRLVQALLTIELTPGVTPADLAVRMGVSRSMASQLLRRLDVAGLVHREPADADLRSIRLHLTKDGRARVADLERVLGDYFVENRDAVSRIVANLGVDTDERPQAPASMLTATIGIARAATTYVSEAARMFVDLSLGDHERLALTILACDGPQQPAGLSRRLNLTTAAISGIVDRVVAAGLARRDLAPPLHDRRAVLVEATPSGLLLARRLATLLGQHASSLGPALRAACAVAVRTPAN